MTAVLREQNSQSVQPGISAGTGGLLDGLGYLAQVALYFAANPTVLDGPLRVTGLRVRLQKLGDRSI
ncbi:MAG: hypothetical protein ISS58_07870 [Dehalococcoidales bacterium]|nr:hypothetical protein [Dehalococcoidales bacterium]